MELEKESKIQQVNLYIKVNLIINIMDKYWRISVKEEVHVCGEVNYFMKVIGKMIGSMAMEGWLILKVLKDLLYMMGNGFQIILRDYLLLLAKIGELKRNKLTFNLI